jgi:predicted RNA methylase
VVVALLNVRELVDLGCGTARLAVQGNWMVLIPHKQLREDP